MKRTLVLLLILISAVALVGCNKDNNEDIVLNTVSMFGGTDANKDVYNSLIELYEARMPNVTVSDQSASSDETWKGKVIADFGRGNEPDVLQFFTGETAASFVDSNKVVSIEDIRKVYPDYAKNINPAVIGTHSIPTTGFVEGIFTNTDHFKSAESKALLNKGKLTWTEFKTLLGLLKTENSDIAGYAPIAYGTDIPHYWLDHIVAADLGINYYEAITGEGGAAKMKSALTKLSEVEQYFSKDESYGLSEQGFFDGKYTFILDGSWFASRVKLPNATVLPFPALNETHGTPILAGYTSGFYITKKAWDNPQKREAAVKFVETMTSTQALTLFAGVGGFAADDNAKPSAITAINNELANLLAKTDFQALPLGDASKAGTYAGLVTAQAAFIFNNDAEATAAINAYLNAQKG